MTPEPAQALVIGAGPAGLMAADVLLAAGIPVILAEAKPSPGRKLLMAGKSGLNVTKDEPLPQFLSRYDPSASWLRPMLTAFGPGHVREWLQEQRQEVFTGSSGRVFPSVMKASPLLRQWLATLAGRGLDLRLRWRCVGLEHGTFVFETPDGPRRVASACTVVALGGASWARLGSDGGWAPLLAANGVALTPFRPANAALRIRWSAHMTRHIGAPVKSVAFIAGDLRSRGEAVITATGLEGGGIYTVSNAIREGAALEMDLFPDLDTETIAARLAARPASDSVSNRLRKAVKLTGARLALARECAHPLPTDGTALATLLKRLPVPNAQLAPLDEAISTAGGIAQGAFDGSLMLRNLPGVFAAGEMLDWEAPTGGYLLTACLATGRWAGQAAARWSDRDRDGGHHQIRQD
ncbi:MAG: putative flavoprotein [Rhodobacteraceae bacterium HLUCCA12]|nr:MAG: putative flavoprotein [Rhodobacteraceae bacterium HLUCCA12]